MGHKVYTPSAKKGFQVIDLESMTAEQRKFLENKGVLKPKKQPKKK